MNVFVTFSLVLFLPLVAHASSGTKNEQWVTKDELSNKLPKTLAPIWEGKAQVRGECFTLCQLKQCSSLAFSDVKQSCKLYFHNDLPKPLPDLTNDWTGWKHKMFYKKWFCPSGWEMDKESQKCYFIDDSAEVSRNNAWQICEDHLMSELVTFKSVEQRNNLYEILRNNHSGINNYWNGYYQWQRNFWLRQVDEIPGYIRSQRGDCPFNDIANFFTSINDCASKCDKEYRDRCVGFVYNRVEGRCWLKHRLCSFNSNTKTLQEENHVYDKIHAARPMSSHHGIDAGGQDVVHVSGLTEYQCKSLIKKYPEGAHAIFFGNNNPTSCFVHRYGTPHKTSSTATVGWDRNDVAHKKCPYGLRYRDVCLVYNWNTGSRDSHEAWCLSMGGKLTT